MSLFLDDCPRPFYFQGFTLGKLGLWILGGALEPDIFPVCCLGLTVADVEDLGEL
jgi:hypothetical protein